MSYPLLERINAPGEIKNLPADEMPALCEEIRQFLIKSCLLYTSDAADD